MTPKSFLIILKDFFSNAIEYNSLFYAKEYILDKSRPKSKPYTALDDASIKFKRSQSARPNDHLTSAILTLPNNLERFEWKKDLPEVYDQLENFLSLSFRDTIYPPLSKKVVSSKKLQSEIRSAMAKVRQLDKSKRNLRTKVDIKASRPSSSVTLNHSQVFNLNDEFATTSHFIDESHGTFILPLTSNLSENLTRYNNKS